MSAASSTPDADVAALRTSLATMLQVLIDAAATMCGDPALSAMRDEMASQLAELIRHSCQVAVDTQVAAAQAFASLGEPRQ